MNEVVFRLAHQTACILESVFQEPGESYTVDTNHYFQRLGLNTRLLTHNSFDDDALSTVCSEINFSLRNQEKIFLLLLLQECLLKKHDLAGFNEKLVEVFRLIGIDTGLIKKFRGFLEQDEQMAITSNEYLMLTPEKSIGKDMLEGRWFEDNVRSSVIISNEALDAEQIHGHMLIMFVEQIHAYVIRCINNNEKVFDQDTDIYCNFRLLRPGMEYSIKGVPVITYSDIKARFLQLGEKRELTFSIDRLQYGNKKGIKDIHTFSTRETTGRLIGIVGREGVGKSVLLKLLAGKYKPSSGSIAINGFDLWSNRYRLKGVIGFVPEEDLLFEDLTVEDNLALTARLYYSSLSKKETEAKVNALLSRLDLLELKHTIIGKTDNKEIQPGQRRLLNIALELLREPQILLVDNALSGLAMSDATKVIKVLHDYSFSGNLVITSIHQVDSESFMLFDKIWVLDEGGYPVYNGSVKAAPAYIFRNLKLTYRENIKNDPAHILDWLGYRLPDEKAQVWKRVLEPGDWHDLYLREEALKVERSSDSRVLFPARILKIPNLEVQLLIFSIRNFKCKFYKLNEIFKAVLIGPLTAVIIALLLRSTGPDGYFLYHNDNIPIFLFISVVVAIFMGLIASIDEINRERNILEKEEYLEFSRFSYLNSKILYLFPVIALQIMLYVLTANLILGIKELYWVYWMVLFSSACFGAVLGLILSSGIPDKSFLHKAVLPFIIALQLLLGGGIIPYEKLNLQGQKYTPFIGDLMVSRWAYEALAVEQFKKNSYEKLIFPSDSAIDQTSFYVFHVLPKLEQSLNTCLNSVNEDSIQDNLAILYKEFNKVSLIPDVFPFEFLDELDEIREKPEIAAAAVDYLPYLSRHFYEQYQNNTRLKSALITHLSDSLTIEGLMKLRQQYHNEALERVVTNKASDKVFAIIDNEIVKTSGTIYQKPVSSWGRARLYSPDKKQFNGQITGTLWYNISMIWLLTSLCYIWVLFDLTGILRDLFSFTRKS